MILKQQPENSMRFLLFVGFDASKIFCRTCQQLKSWHELFGLILAMSILSRTLHCNMIVALSLRLQWNVTINI